MATSTTSTYNPNRGRIVQLALIDVGAIGPDAISPATEASQLALHANDLLSQLMMSHDSYGAMLWRVQRRTLAITQGTATYTLDSDVYDLDAPGRYVQSGQTSGSVVMPMSRDEYMSYGDRTVQGSPPIRYLCEHQLATVPTGLETISLTFYPVPSATGDTFEYAAVIKARDQSTDAQTLDVPQKWIRCMRYGLALDLAPGYGLPMDRINHFKGMYESERDRLIEDDNERGDVQVAPFGAYFYGSSAYGSRGGR